MAKLLPKHGVEEEKRDNPSPEIPTDPTSACRVAKVQENRTIRALEDARDRFDTAESYRVLSRFLRNAQADLEKFEACS
jgi:hypothetical protein